MEFSFLDAISTSLVAMSIVFTLLIILHYIIRFQSFILSIKLSQDKVHKVEVVSSEEIVEETVQEGDVKGDLEVVAAIAAALSAYLDIPTSKLIIKRIKRVNSNWN
jgi:Na+-transporting methylmalonyl-CoA/oxaloacetate decarboxylase gamma subunit